MKADAVMTKRDWANGHLTLTTRRAVLALGACALARPSVADAATEWTIERLPTPTPWVQLRSGPAGSLLGTDRGASVWQFSAGSAARRLADGIDPSAPVAFGHGRIVARRSDGRLWVGGGAPDAGISDVAVAPHAGLLVLPLAVIAVTGSQGDGLAAHLIRLEPAAGTWKVVARSKEPVLPDSRPIQIDLDGRGDGGHVLVLGGPDRTRYPHAVLGDDIEATRVLWLERHDLSVLRSLTIEAPYVLEDIAPRPWRASGAQHSLITMRSGPQGGQLALIEADAASTSALKLAALGPPIGTRMRWLSPIMSPTAEGKRLMAVHTPHIGGVLHRYRRDGDQLVAERVIDNASNHAIGSRELDVSAWMGSMLLIADRARQRLLVIDTERAVVAKHFDGIGAVVQMVNGPGNNAVTCLTAEGALWLVKQPAARR
jgi:hypothetical protein